MNNNCISKFPNECIYDDYAKTVDELGNNYYEKGLFQHLPKDRLDQDIMAEVSLNKNSKFLSMDKLNLTYTIAKIRRELELENATPPTTDDEKYRQAIELKKRLIKIILSNPEFQKANGLTIENVKHLLLTTNVRQYIKPELRGVKAPEIIEIENIKFNEKNTKPILVGDEFKNGDKNSNKKTEEESESEKLENKSKETHQEELKMAEKEQVKKQEKKKKEKEIEEEFLGMGM